MTAAAKWIGAWACLVLLAALPARAQEPPARRLSPTPRFTPGQTLRYQMEFRATSEGGIEGIFENPQAPKRVETSVSGIVKLESLKPDSGAPLCSGCARLRLTYEKLASTTKSDVPAPDLADNEAQLARLQGRSIEFTLEPGGRLSDLRGLDDILPEERRVVEDWLAQLAAGPGVPKEGVVPGQKWSAEQPGSGRAPLAGLLWRTESTYLRDESCRIGVITSEGVIQPVQSTEICAVILTRFEMVQHSPADPTPEAYRLRGLRTSGQARGSGESLAYVSLATGLIVSVTQSSDEEMNLSVSTADGEQGRFKSRVRTQANITLLGPSGPVVP